MAKILIIDDDRDLVEQTKIVLESAGYIVASAGNREAGLAAVVSESPDLILLDVMMENEDDGIVIAQNLRKGGNKTPIIMLTNVGKVMGVDFGKDDDMVPVNEFVEKPIDPETLKQKIKELLK